MANEEQRIPGILEDVDESELGQLSPGYTPYMPEMQSWNRGRSLGLGGDINQLGRSSHLPESTWEQSEDGLKAAQDASKNLSEHQDFATSQQTTQQQDRSAAAHEIVGHLDQFALSSRDQVRLDNREQEAIQKQSTEPVQQQEQRQLEGVKEQQQDKVPLDSSAQNKLDTRQQGVQQQKEATPTQSQKQQEREVSQDKDQEKDHER